MTRRTSIALRSALAATVGTVCLLASTGSNAGVYAHRSHVTGRPTLLPRYYGGGYDTGGYYGAYASGTYPGGYDGSYVNRSYVTGRPTLLPRYYGGYDTGGYDDAYAAVGYPDGYYGGYVNPFRSYRGGPKSGWWD